MFLQLQINHYSFLSMSFAIIYNIFNMILLSLKYYIKSSFIFFKNIFFHLLPRQIYRLYMMLFHGSNIISYFYYFIFCIPKFNCYFFSMVYISNYWRARHLFLSPLIIVSTISINHIIN